MPGRARPRLPRARRRGRSGPSQRRAGRTAEDGRGHDRLRRAAGRRARRALPLGDPRPPEGPHRGARGAGGRTAGPRAVGPRHRGRLPRRERPTAAVAHGGLRTGRAALGRLPGLRQPRSRRAQGRLPLRRRDRGAHPARPAARACDGGLGVHRHRSQGAARADDRLQGGRRNGHGVLPGHARPRSRRPAAGGLGQRAGRDQGGRDPGSGSGAGSAFRARRASAASRTA